MQIQNMETAREAFNFSQDKGHMDFQREDWDSVKDDVMEKAVRAKFLQHRELADMLLNTGDAELVEHTHRDRYCSRQHCWSH